LIKIVSDTTLEKHLAENFESGLREFLLLPTLERLKKAKDLFRWNNEELRLIFEKYSDFIERDFEGKTDQEKEEYLYNSDDNLKAYLNREYQYMLYYLPYFIWASHLIFDGTYSQLTYEAKEELREYCGLDTPKKRKDAYTNLFARFIDEKVVDGGSESHWNEWTRLLFLSHYERFSIVIENSRNDIKKLKKQRVAIMDIKKEILEKYRIPDEYWSDVIKTGRKDKLARNWAKVKIQKSFDEKITSKMGFADSYLIKVLESARKNAEKHLSCCKKYSNHKLIFLNWGDTRVFQHNYRLKKEAILELKFDSYAKKEMPGMELYFV